MTNSTHHHPSTTHRYTAQLGREWERLRSRPANLAEARSWKPAVGAGRLADVLDDLYDLDQLVALTNDPTRRCADADTVMLQLVVLAKEHQLAGRIVIQRILPGLIARSARYRSGSDGIDPAEMVIAAAWIAINRYDVSRRRRHVAASLISDATFQAFRRPLRRRAAHEVVTSCDHFAQRSAPPVAVTALEQLAEVIRIAKEHGLPPADLQLVCDLVRVGSPTIIAAQRGVTPRTIRNHRDRAIANIRAALQAA
jgi:hypothetical protein